VTKDRNEWLSRSIRDTWESCEHHQATKQAITCIQPVVGLVVRHSENNRPIRGEAHE